MFWIQALLPITLISIGLYLWLDKQSVISENVQDKFRDLQFAIVQRFQEMQDRSGIKPRLNELGKSSKTAYGEFRYQQLALASGFALLPFLGLFAMFINLLQAIALSIFFGIGTYLIIDRKLDNQVKRFREQQEAEFPALIELMTLAIAAGETPISAFARVADRSNASLAREFKSVIEKVKLGRPFHVALDEMGRTLNSSAIRRFVDALVMAMVRGAPVVEVLHRHVAEARVNQRNLVMDKAGRAETKMMVPIVFLILPISVLFALWPSINQMSFFAN